MPKCSRTYLSKHLEKSLSYQIMELMTQGIAMMLYESSECFRSFRHEKGLLSGSKDRVGSQKLYGSNKNKKWKPRYGYHKRSLSETVMYRVKQLLGRKLRQRNYNAQVGETYVMINATRLGMSETQCIV